MPKFSTSLKNYMLVTGSLHGALSGGVIRLFGGPVPDSADDATTNAVLLGVVTESDDGTTGLTFGSASDGTMQKTATETWKSTYSAAGTLSFYRFCTTGDDGTGADDGSSTYRIQGTIGETPAYDMKVPQTTVASGGTFGPITTFDVIMGS